MLTLYYEPGCPYCQKVLDAGEELGLTFNKRSVDDFGVNDELIARGGSQQVPFLIDDENGVEMYESDAIVKYLHERFGKMKV